MMKYIHIGYYYYYWDYYFRPKTVVKSCVQTLITYTFNYGLAPFFISSFYIIYKYLIHPLGFATHINSLAACPMCGSMRLCIKVCGKITQ